MASHDRESAKESRALALVPVSVCVILLALLMPRSTRPESVPLPLVDDRAFTAAVEEDVARARDARQKPLPAAVLGVGTAFRAFQAAAARRADETATVQVRTALNAAVSVVTRRGEASSALRDLRALQLEAFLEAERAFEHTHQVTPDLQELGGPFVDRMRAVGWLENDRFVGDERQLRVAYKAMWNAVIGDATPELALTLDEQRALYGLYLAHPHAPEIRRDELAAERAAARTEAECDRALATYRRAVESWRADKIRALGRMDPTYPTQYALGVALYRAGQHDLAAQAFQAWLSTHPDGPYSLRAKNHLKAAAEASGAF